MVARRPLVRTGGTDKQLPAGDTLADSLLSANLSAFGGLTGEVDKLPYFTGAGALSLATLTAAGRTLLAAANTTDQRAALGAQAALGYTPVQQGTGVGQTNNEVKIGWSASNSLLITVGSTDFANSWPISISKNAATATKLATARNINGVPFDGTGSITVADGTKLPLTGGAMTGSITNSAAALIQGTNGGTVRGYLYNDSNGFGILNTWGGWSARTPVGTSDWYVTGKLQVTDGRGSIQHVIDGANNHFLNFRNETVGVGVTSAWLPNIGHTFSPTIDAGMSSGWGLGRWSAVWSSSGAIQTSDAREKTSVRPLAPNELAAAKQLADELGIYQWLEAVEKKGSSARMHFGQTVQRVIGVMESHGMDPFAYGIACYDEWAAVPDVISEEGDVTVEGREAGNRYSMRYDELAMFLVRGQAQRQTELEARISAIEEKNQS